MHQNLAAIRAHHVWIIHANQFLDSCPSNTEISLSPHSAVTGANNCVWNRKRDLKDRSIYWDQRPTTHSPLGDSFCVRVFLVGTDEHSLKRLGCYVAGLAQRTHMALSVPAFVPASTKLLGCVCERAGGGEVYVGIFRLTPHMCLLCYPRNYHHYYSG